MKAYVWFEKINNERAEHYYVPEKFVLTLSDGKLINYAADQKTLQENQREVSCRQVHTAYEINRCYEIEFPDELADKLKLPGERFAGIQIAIDGLKKRQNTTKLTLAEICEKAELTKLPRVVIGG